MGRAEPERPLALARLGARARRPARDDVERDRRVLRPRVRRQRRPNRCCFPPSSETTCVLVFATEALSDSRSFRLPRQAAVVGEQAHPTSLPRVSLTSSPLIIIPSRWRPTALTVQPESTARSAGSRAAVAAFVR